MTDETRLSATDVQGILDYVRTHRDFDTLTSEQTLIEVQAILENWRHLNGLD